LANILRIDRIYQPKLSLDRTKVTSLTIRPEETSFTVDIAPTVEGKPHLDKISTIEIEELGNKFRLQTSIFKISRDVYEKFKPDNWKGNKEYLLIQIVNIVEEFLKSKKLRIPNTLFDQDKLRRKILIALNMSKIVHHIWTAIVFQNISKISLIFDKEKQIRSTSDMIPWYTTKPTEYTKKSHINHATDQKNSEVL
jgi:type III restriction enzyme